MLLAQAKDVSRTDARVSKSKHQPASALITKPTARVRLYHIILNSMTFYCIIRINPTTRGLCHPKALRCLSCRTGAFGRRGKTWRRQTKLKESLSSKASQPGRLVGHIRVRSCPEMSMSLSGHTDLLKLPGALIQHRALSFFGFRDFRPPLGGAASWEDRTQLLDTRIPPSAWSLHFVETWTSMETVHWQNLYSYVRAFSSKPAHPCVV